MKTQRADLHSHGPIGLQLYWLQKQGYAGRNPLELMAEQCRKKGITVSAITSHADAITPFSVQDRWESLRQNEASRLRNGWNYDELGDRVMVLEKEGSTVYFVNTQTVMPREKDQRYALTVIGSNRLPNDKTMTDTITMAHDLDSLIGAEGGMLIKKEGRSLIEKNITELDFLEGHDAQRRFSHWMRRFPFIGRASVAYNQEMKNIGIEYNKPLIAVSNSHRIEDMGRSYIEWDGELPTTSADTFLSAVKDAVKGCGSLGGPVAKEMYEPLIPWIKWNAQFLKGLRRPDQEREIYVPSIEIGRDGQRRSI